MAKITQLTKDAGPSILDLGEKERELFNYLVELAKFGKLMPTNDWFRCENIEREKKLRINLLPSLARMGYLRIILYNGQLRQIEISVGSSAGYSTKKPPGARKIIRIIDKSSPPASRKTP
jgi:hypothetical protein